MPSPIQTKKYIWNGWILPAWWGRWHRGPHPPQEGLTGPQRCIQHRHRWSPVRWEVKTIWIQHSNPILLDHGLVGSICMQVEKLKLYDTELKIILIQHSNPIDPHQGWVGRVCVSVTKELSVAMSERLPGKIVLVDGDKEGTRLGVVTHLQNDLFQNFFNR